VSWWINSDRLLINMRGKQKMKEKVIGILGGMGPEATVNCFDKLTRNTPAKYDQEHLQVIIYSNPKVPDRTKAILNDGPSPLPFLIEGCRRLARAGADFIIIPCVTAHYFLKELRQETALPILSILDAVAENICKYYPKIQTVGLMGTSGTLKSGIFQKRMIADGIKCIVCPDNAQGKVMGAIYAIKKGVSLSDREKLTNELSAVAQGLVESGAEGIIAGCTEIPLGLTRKDVKVPYFDSLLLLARDSIRRAGREPKPEI